MNNEQKAIRVAKDVCGNIGRLDSSDNLEMQGPEIVSRSDFEIPVAAARVVTDDGPMIVLADIAESVLVPVQDARKVAAYLLAHAQDGPSPQGMRRVRIAVGVTRDGYWQAWGCGVPQGSSSDWHIRDEVLEHLSIETDEPVTIHWIEADIQLPSDDAIQAYPLPGCE